MAFSQEIVKRTSNEIIYKLVSDAENLRSTLIDLRGATSVFGSCTGTIKAYLPSVDDGLSVAADIGKYSVPGADQAFMEVTGSNVASGQYYPCVSGDATQPLIIPSFAMPLSCYFTLAASKTAYVYIKFGCS